jgi:beta-RFAP synthase
MNATQNLRNRPVETSDLGLVDGDAADDAHLPDRDLSLRSRPGCMSVRTSARLHLGFLDLNYALGRRFGSLGLSLDRPVTRLVIRRAHETLVCGPERERVERYLAAMRTHLALSAHHDVAVHAAIPPHAGLGSGTQLALAVASALRRLHGRPADLRGDAARLGRGGRSGIGIGLFSHGGFVIDGGKGGDAAPPPLLARVAIPKEWRVLLVMDPACTGLSGAAERAAFAALAPMPEAQCGAICRLVLMQALPALRERDLPAFGAAITAVQQHLGTYFAPAQGGRFTSGRVAKAMALLEAAGAAGIGQSSWGATGFAFAPDLAAARNLSQMLHNSTVAKGLDLIVCRALNRGASLRSV